MFAEAINFQIVKLIHYGACVLSHFSHVWLFVTLWTVGFSVHGILQARILEWVAMPSSRGSSLPRETHISCVSCIAGRFITTEPLNLQQKQTIKWRIK